MKTILRFPVQVAIIALLCIGCAGSRPAYQTLAGVGFTVDKAMTVAADQRVSGKLSEAQWARIETAHAVYRKAYTAALTAAESTVESLAPADVMNLATAVLAAAAATE